MNGVGRGLGRVTKTALQLIKYKGDLTNHMGFLGLRNKNGFFISYESNLSSYIQI